MFFSLKKCHPLQKHEELKSERYEKDWKNPATFTSQDFSQTQFDCHLQKCGEGKGQKEKILGSRPQDALVNLQKSF